MSLSLAVFWNLRSTGVALSGSQFFSLPYICQNEVKSGRFSTNWWGLVSLVPEPKSKFRVLNHLTATPAWRFFYCSFVHDAKCIIYAKSAFFVLFLREMCVARDKLLCICFWESLFSVARLQTFLIGPWPWALILVIMT